MTGDPKNSNGADSDSKPSPNIKFTCHLLANANGTEVTLLA